MRKSAAAVDAGAGSGVPSTTLGRHIFFRTTVFSTFENEITDNRCVRPSGPVVVFDFPGPPLFVHLTFTLVLSLSPLRKHIYRHTSIRPCPLHSHSHDGNG